MAINLVPYPSTSAPTDNDDYTKQNTMLSAKGVPQASILTDWELTAAAPLLKQGAYIYHEGNYYQVQTADEAISGTPAAGVNYIAMTLSGTTLTATWTQSKAGYSFDAAYGGVYDVSTPRKLLLSDVCYLDGTDYKRGRCFGADFNSYILADGTAIIKDLNASTITATSTITRDGGTAGKATIDSGAIELGKGRSVDGVAYVDLTSEGGVADYNTRVIRLTGENGETQIIHKGTGPISIKCPDGAVFTLGVEESHSGKETHYGSEEHYGAEEHNGTEYHLGDTYLTGTIYPGAASSSVSNVLLQPGAFFTLPAGVWIVTTRDNGWYGGLDYQMTGCTVFSNGATRFYNNSAASADHYYYRRIA